MSRSLLAVVSAATLIALGAPAARAAYLPQVWVQGPSLPQSFAPRWDAASAAFPPKAEVVLFGGAPADIGDAWHNDTWLFSSATQTWLPGPFAPPGLTPRGGAAMAYDPDLGKIVMFGGAGPSWPPLNQTWLFDGLKWTQGPAAPGGLEGRTGAGMVYDDALGEIVLFGGSGTMAHNDTWLFDGTAWTKGPAAPAGMSPRVFFGMTYDPLLGKVIVAGGDGGTDVWEFDGASWTPGPDLTSDIGGRERVALAFDPQLGGDVLFGGIGPGSANNSMYLLQGGAWQFVTMHPNPKPTSRLEPNLVWDPVRQAFMMFGGADDQNNGRVGLTDTWLIVSPPVTLDPISGPAGTRVDITSGPGWTPGSTEHVKFDGGQLKDVIAPASGTIATTITIPSVNPGSYQVALTNDLQQIIVQASFRVIPHAGPSRGGGGASRPARTSGGGSSSSGSVSTRAPSTRFVPTPATATGQITAHDGDFWLAGNPVLLHGMDAAPIQNGNLSNTDYANMQSWNMNLVRMRVWWASIEPQPPQKDHGTWIHSYDTGEIADLITQIGRAAAHGEYVIIENYCGPPCFGKGYPDWLYTAPYNSHGIDYTDATTANTDYWTDPLMQQFTGDFDSWLAKQLVGVPGVIGYEPLNEPNQGTYPDGASTTSMIMNVQYTLAQRVRAADPKRVIFFTTRGSSGEGAPNADFSPWTAMGNVAFDVHGYFGGRWGGGLVADPASPLCGEGLQSLYDFTLTPTNPPYLGTTYAQERWVETFKSVMDPLGVPILVGEFGGQGELEPNIMALYGTMTQAFNLEGVAWAANSYNGDNSVFTDSGGLEPWAPLLAAAAAYGGG